MSNDIEKSIIKLTLVANVQVELSVKPMRLHFQEMKKGEAKTESFELVNTYSKPLEILPIDIHDENVKIELEDKSKKWPIELKPDEKVKFLATVTYNTDNQYFSNTIKIKYTGGEATDAVLRLSARKLQIPQEPEITAIPVNVHFPEMKKGQTETESFELKNTYSKPLEILPIDIQDENIKIELEDKSKKWPIELKPDEKVKFFVTLTYDTDSHYYLKTVKIKYTGGEATEILMRLSAIKAQITQEVKPETPTSFGETDTEGVEEKSEMTLKGEEKIVSPPANQDTGDDKKPKDKEVN